jgi:ATP-binding cassette subfamily B protein
MDQVEEVTESNLYDFDGTDFSGHVEFKDINFSYKEDQELIKDLNLEVYPGRQIAIVGPTGAGKTTLVNLLMRFYEISSGSILIDGKKSTDVTRNNLRGLFGMVLQDTWLFAGSIKDNVKYGKRDATDEEVVAACKQAHVHHFIETLPEGYDTMLKEDAANISQGQKQLLTIARAILCNPRILILDEATSSVDTRTESYIQNAMDFMMKGKTSFVIAHRLSTIKNANLILVMNHGAIVEQGNHKDLLAKNGVYADLYNAQFLNQAT